jgi:hypothetical protein
VHFVYRLLPVVVTVVVVSMFELLVVDVSETDVCGELCGPSDVVIFSLVWTTDTTTGKSLVTSELSHDMLKLKIHIHEILNNNFRLEFPKLNKWIVKLKGTNPSDVVIFSLVCSVVIGASQTIRKTCEWSLLISEILSCVEYMWKFCFYVLYFQVCNEQQSVSIAFWPS